MKSPGKHRAHHESGQARISAMIVGGLVASSAATVGVSSASEDPPSSGRPRPALPSPAPAARDVAGLRGGSLAEMREQTAADRSLARSAPVAAAAPTTLLQESFFTAATLQAPATPSQPTAPPAADDEHPAQAAAQQPPRAPAVPVPAQTSAPVQPQAQAQAVHPTTTVQAPAARSAGSLLDVAAAYVGYPYVLYGTPPQSFDCSAYTWYVFQQAGIDIPRTVAGQKGAVTPVSDPQPGDLVFYNDWYHVGIYAGGGMTYEALNPSTDVRYGPLLSSNVWYGRIN
ncbi:C40 family peptidase [Ornithinimicrobium sp. LYQ103]|uniref:C40 family peptidase n=1 Tax=Ornithinimicrobium sp. LYQ103 TaxID=3378796 RepID=UPI003853E78D